MTSGFGDGKAATPQREISGFPRTWDMMGMIGGVRKRSSNTGSHDFLFSSRSGGACFMPRRHPIPFEFIMILMQQTGTNLKFDMIRCKLNNSSWNVSAGICPVVNSGDQSGMDGVLRVDSKGLEFKVKLLNHRKTL